jgi:hypothetical protein
MGFVLFNKFNNFTSYFFEKARFDRIGKRELNNYDIAFL